VVHAPEHQAAVLGDPVIVDAVLLGDEDRRAGERGRVEPRDHLPFGREQSARQTEELGRPRARLAVLREMRAHRLCVEQLVPQPACAAGEKRALAQRAVLTTDIERAHDVEQCRIELAHSS
jgi:hypothetical protein